MTPRQLILSAVAVLGGLALAGCQTDSREQLLKTGKSQVELRSFQSRSFDTSNKKQALRTVIATLQDLSFVVDKADAVLGSVTASKLDHTTARLPYQLRMTVTVRPRGVTQMIVRANATYNVTPVEDPEPYQQFFTALSKSFFLEANATGGADYPAPQGAPPQTASASAGTASVAANPALSQQFVSTASRDAAYSQAKQDIEQKYERLMTNRRKERYGLGCDKSVKKARTQACQDVSFQVELLEETKRKELDALEGQYRRAIVRKPRSQTLAARNGSTGGTGSDRPVSAAPPSAEDCEAGTHVNFVYDRSAIKKAIEDFAFDQGIGEPYPSRSITKFNGLTPKSISCGQIEVRAAIVVPLSSLSGRDTDQTHNFVLQKEDSSFRVVSCRSC
ncbi:MAG: hypothetical protein MJE12_30625 [Alphaproteobacteria bacterium]|nr:hypothetical protein [Alphaproteobacteria bacterium]